MVRLVETGKGEREESSMKPTVILGAVAVAAATALLAPVVANAQTVINKQCHHQQR
jgi:hypothetical protein